MKFKNIEMENRINFLKESILRSFKPGCRESLLILNLKKIREHYKYLSNREIKNVSLERLLYILKKEEKLVYRKNNCWAINIPTYKVWDLKEDISYGHLLSNYKILNKHLHMLYKDVFKVFKKDIGNIEISKFNQYSSYDIFDFFPKTLNFIKNIKNEDFKNLIENYFFSELIFLNEKKIKKYLLNIKIDFHKGTKKFFEYIFSELIGKYNNEKSYLLSKICNSNVIKYEIKRSTYCGRNIKYGVNLINLKSQKTNKLIYGAHLTDIHLLNFERYLKIQN